MSTRYRADTKQFEFDVAAINTSNVNISSLTPTYPVFADSNSNLVTFPPVPVPSTTMACSISGYNVQQTVSPGTNNIIFGTALDGPSYGASYSSATGKFTFPNIASNAIFLVTCNVQVLVNNGATTGSFVIGVANAGGGPILSSTPDVPSGYYELSFTQLVKWDGTFLSVYFNNTTDVNCSYLLPSISIVRID